MLFLGICSQIQKFLVLFNWDQITDDTPKKFDCHVLSFDESQFNDISNELDSNKLFQISMDGPNVNLKFYEAVVTERNENEQHQLINIGSCGLHKIHGAFKTGF